MRAGDTAPEDADPRAVDGLLGLVDVRHSLSSSVGPTYEDSGGGDLAEVELRIGGGGDVLELEERRARVRVALPALVSDDLALRVQSVAGHCDRVGVGRR